MRYKSSTVQMMYYKPNQFNKRIGTPMVMSTEHVNKEAIPPRHALKSEGFDFTL